MLWKVVGYIRLKFCGDNIYGFIEKLRTNNIEVKNLKKLAGSYYGDILSSNLKNVVKISNESEISISVEGRFGIAMKIFIYRNRMAFMCASLVFCIIFALNSLFIKTIHISGNSYLTDNQIKSIISECGIYEGKPTWTIKPDVTKEDIMEKCDHLSWVWVYVKGTSAYVDVREKIPKPEIFNPEEFCNIVAEKNGVVVEIVSQAGTTYAKVGDFVKKGDLLIGGIYDSNDYAPLRFVHSCGSVLAKTSYSIEGPVVTSIVKYKNSDESKNFFAISAMGNEMKFGTGKQSMNIVTERKKEITIFGKNYFALGFTKSKYCEIIKEEYRMGYDEASKLTIQNLTTRLKSTLPDDAEIVDVKEEFFENSKGETCARVTIECIEDIGTELPIDTGSYNMAEYTPEDETTSSTKEPL